MTVNPKKTGINHLIAAGVYAFDGLMVLLKEAAFRHELIFLCATVLLFIFTGASVADYLTMLVLWFVLVAFEAINTAIEYIVDKLSPEISDFAKKVKDLGSLAVFFMISGNVLFVLYVMFYK